MINIILFNLKSFKKIKRKEKKKTTMTNNLI